MRRPRSPDRGRAGTRHRLRLVCVPGTLCNFRVFEPLIAALTEAGQPADFVTVDVTGARSAMAAAALVSAEIGRSVAASVLVGFSLGGIVAIQAALASQAGLRGLVLIDMNGEADRPENAANRRAAVARARQGGVGDFMRREIWPTHASAARIDDQELEELLVTMAEQVGAEAFANQAEIAIGRPRALDRCGEIMRPTLVICGEEDRITPPYLSADIARSIPDSRLALIPGAGHFGLLECPAAMADIIARWLADLPAPSAA
jgi:pimeloyl-ACP methyl ester carboxylesterase